MDEKVEVKNITESAEDAFCRGFAYGVRYGHENILHGKMTNTEIAGHWILAKLLYRELKEK